MNFLKIAYLIGGYYDILLSMGLLFLNGVLFPIFDLPIPSELIFVQVLGLFLLVIGVFLIYTADNAKDYYFVGLGSAFVRIIDDNTIELIYTHLIKEGP